ncbi:phage tail spike protein [Corynebacterium sp. 142RC1]|uniref:phage tail spike protein n=1 Tax=unclassified Corynebacterium TaxID=2624378 RepID=UPI00211CBE91|nr:phage tail protein [Corynebacterium sp. 142RC1]MCQ9365370.1 phage tail protein [Corynebacterium sp. 70RC1]
MITIHPENTTSFTHTGFGHLTNDLIEPVVTEEISGEYSLTFTYPADAILAEQVKVGALVACHVPTVNQRQAFRIVTVEHALNGLLRVKALHLSYDLAKVLIADTNIVNKDANQALLQLRGATNPPNAFTALSSFNATPRTVRVVRQSVLECLMDTGGDNTFAARYGGEMLRNNLHFEHRTRLGSDQGVTIRDRKNLTGYQATIDYTHTLTRILPVGYDGLVLPEKYVDSPRLNDYPKPLVGVVKFDHIKAQKPGEEPREGELPLKQAHAALRQAAQAAFNDGLDLPAASFEVNFIDLTSTREYQNTAQLEKVVLGDTVTVIHTDYNTHLKARIVGYTYNPATRQYIALKLGTVTPSFTSTTRTLTRSMDAVKADAQTAVETALAAQVSANGKNTIHYGPTQPATAQLGDTWFKENGDQTEIWVYKIGSNGEATWVSIASNLNTSLMQAELDELQSVLAGVNTKVAAVEGLADEFDTRLFQTQREFKSLEEGLVFFAQKVMEVETTTNQQVSAAMQKADQTAQAHDALRLEFNSNMQSNEQALVAIRNDVLLRATKGDLIAQINVSPETILIDSKRIHITGTTTIDDAVIKTAMIQDAAINNAKIVNLDASKITTGYLAAARIQTGAITSDKLTVANGFIKTAMIADSAITNAKIATLDAAKITTGTLSAGRIAANSITADKLATNAIQVGLAGWTQSIRISPTQISWYDGTTLEGTITSSGMKFYYGTRHIGDVGRRQKKDAPTVQGIINHLAPGGDYTAWTFQETTTSDSYTYFTFDPKGKFYGQRGIHMGADLRTHGFKFYTNGHRFVTLEDVTLGTRGTFPGWSGSGGRAQVVFTSNDLMIVTNNTYYSMTAIGARISDLIMRVNSLISTFNRGWVQSIRDNGGGTVAWQSYSNTGLSAMSTTVS